MRFCKPPERTLGTNALILCNVLHEGTDIAPETDLPVHKRKSRQGAGSSHRIQILQPSAAAIGLVEQAASGEMLFLDLVPAAEYVFHGQ